jgi:hypothetical protein
MRLKGMTLIILCILFLVGGCATVQVVDEHGRPVPDHVVRGRIPSMGMRIDSALIRYFGQTEGDELLETFEYLNPYAEKQYVPKKHLRSLVLTVHIINPRKETYQFLLYYELPSTDLHGNVLKRQPPIRMKELLYKGNLSLKEFSISLPANDGLDSKMWYELTDEDDDIFFVGPVVHYEVTGLPAFDRTPVSTSSKEDVVTGAGLDDPVRKWGN